MTLRIYQKFIFTHEKGHGATADGIYPVTLYMHHAPRAYTFAAIFLMPDSLSLCARAPNKLSKVNLNGIDRYIIDELNGIIVASLSIVT